MINTRDCNMTGFGYVENWTEVHGTEVHIRYFAQAQAESTGTMNGGCSGNDYRGQADEQIITSDGNLNPHLAGKVLAYLPLEVAVVAAAVRRCS